MMDLRYICLLACLLVQVQAEPLCGFPGSPAHCQVSITGSEEGAVAVYTCERGFELLGPSRRVCGPNGQWTPDGIPFCVINVAAGKAPMQVSTESGGMPQRALDGSTAATFNPETCTLTKPERVPWWYVNLLEPYMVQLVRLDFGKACCGEGKPAEIIVRVGNNRPDLGTNPICNRFIGYIEEGQPLFLPCAPPMPGAFVSVHIEASYPSQLSICEAFVYTDQALPIERCPQFRDQSLGSTATYNGKCYIFYDRQPANFREALGFCRSRGGTLVDESNPALQGFISWELWRRHRSDSSSRYWMGATRESLDTTNWKWVNGKDVVVSFWSNVGGEPCALFDGSKGWLWSDSDCRVKTNYICQHQPKACGRPEQPPNSTMYEKGFQVGATVEFTCDEGHLQIGPTVRTCLDTGFYDEISPICRRIDCGLPAKVKNGNYKLLNGTATYLSHVQYFCDAGYEMVGRSRLICDIDARWNGPPPRCDAVQCGQPPTVANGRVVVSSNTTGFGSIAEYSCARGYKVRGDWRLACLASGQWAGPTPICQLEERTTTTTTTTTSEVPPLPPPLLTVTTPVSTTTQWILPTRRTSSRTSSPAPFLPPDFPVNHRPRLKSPTERTTTQEYERRFEKNRVTVPDSQDSPTSHVPHIIVASHPRENQVFGSGNNIRAEQTPRVNVPTAVDGERREPVEGRINIGAVVTLAGFGALVFLIAIIVTVVILFKSRNRNDNKCYRHQVSPDCVTMATVESSSSESRRGLNRYYRQAWEELHEKAAVKHGRKHEREAPKDESEMVVSDAGIYPENHDKRRHHHHHHHRERFSSWQHHQKPNAKVHQAGRHRHHTPHAVL